MSIFSEWWFWVIVAVVFVVGGYIKLRVLKGIMARRNQPLPDGPED